MNELAGPFRDALVSVDRLRAENLFDQALAGGRPITAVEAVVTPALEEIGRAWERDERALSHVYMAGRFCEELVARVLPPSDPDCNRQPLDGGAGMSGPPLNPMQRTLTALGHQAGRRPCAARGTRRRRTLGTSSTGLSRHVAGRGRRVNQGGCDACRA